MNWEHQKLAKQMFGEWAIIASEIPQVVKTYKRYLTSQAPELLATLDEVATVDYFTKALRYGHFAR